MTEKEQCGTEALTTTAEQITSDFRDGLKGRGALARKFLLDLHKVDAHQVKYFLDRENRDDWPPGNAALNQRGTTAGAVPDRVSGKNRRKLSAVVWATSSTGKFLTFARTCATSAT